MQSIAGVKHKRASASLQQFTSQTRGGYSNDRSAVASFAATGYSVTDIEESRIQIGMSSEQVLQAIGQPFNTVQFRNQEGPTWAYHVSGDVLGVKTFYVDFDAKSKVAAVSEVEIAVGGGDL